MCRMDPALVVLRLDDHRHPVVDGTIRTTSMSRRRRVGLYAATRKRALRRLRVGLWKDAEPVPPWEWRKGDRVKL